MTKTKHLVPVLNVLALTAIIIGGVVYSAYLLKRFDHLSDGPFLAIISNNLGVKNKVMSIQLASQAFRDNPTARSHQKLKMQFRVMKASITNDLKSDVTRAFHQKHGDPATLIEFLQYLDQLGFYMPKNENDRHNTEAFHKLLGKAYKLWNRYSRQVVHAAQEQSLLIQQHWSQSLSIQIYILSAIGVIALIFLILITRQLLTQKMMSQALQVQAEQLTQARNAAEESTQAKSRFLSNMSHEIRTPLNGIIGLTNLARQKAVKPEVINYLDKVILSSDALLHVINDILDVSKIESGKFELEVTQVDIADVFERLSATMSASARDKGLRFYLLIEPELPAFFEGDPARLQQVLTNLLSNAIKFTEDGFIQLEATFDQDSKTLIIRVSDTGIGIPEEAIQHLFKEFSQADPSTTRKFGGTGLGLSIVKSLTELMGGQVSIESKPDEGSCFTLRFPIEPSDTTLFCSDALKSELSGKHIHWLDVHAHFDIDEQFNLNAKEVLERFGVQFVPLEEANSLLIELPQSISEEHAQHLKTTLQEHSDKRCYLVGHTDQIHELTQSLEHTFYSIETPFNTLKVIECLAKEQSHETATSTLMSQCNFNGKHILLVEDSPINQLIAQEMLGLFGLRVTTADNGEIAVEKAQVDVFDLILMDIQMPEMDGMEATRIIRTDSFNQTTPIVALTANVMTEDVKLYKEIGMDCHLPKPFKPEQLISILETYLGNA